MSIATPQFFDSESDVPSDAIRVDALGSAIRELFYIDNPSIAKGSPEASEAIDAYIQSRTTGRTWVYLPWSKTAILLPDENTYFRLRTARNKDLISEKEQLQYREAVVGIAGLSVGSTALSSIVRTGGPKRIKIADHDVVEITNLNRMNASLRDLSMNKTQVAAQCAWEIDPFAQITQYQLGLTVEQLQEFVHGDTPLTVFVDEMDDIPLKFESRLVCKQFGVPVVMATDNGDGAIVDVERFDLERDRPIFHGRVDSSVAKSAKSRAEFIAAARAIIDPTLFSHRQAASLEQIGKTLAGVPQLGSAASIAGTAVAYAVRQIATGAPLPSGRYIISCEQSFSSPARES